MDKARGLRHLEACANQQPTDRIHAEQASWSTLVDHEYGDVTAIGQRHILPTAATRTVAKPQTLLEPSAG